MRKCFLIILVWTIGLPIRAQYHPDTLTSYLSVLYNQSSFPGFAVSIVDAEGILYTRGFGQADQLDELPYNEHTIQPLGGVSNTLVGVAIMKAIELGMLDLDVEINRILPFKVNNPNIKDKAITLRHLVTHTSGILDGPNLYEIAFSPGKRHKYSLNKFLRTYLTPKGRWYNKKNFGKYEPGVRYEYTKIGTSLAAYVVEVAAGMPFNDFTRKFIMTPLGMNDTGWFYDEIEIARHTVLYADWRAPLAYYATATYPGGGLRSSISDLSHFLSDIIRGMSGKSGVLNDTSYQQMICPLFSKNNMPKNMDKSEPNEGVFWVFRHNGLIGHTGSDPGVTALMLFDPESGIGKIFIANREIEDADLSDQMINIWRTLEAHEDRVKAFKRE